MPIAYDGVSLTLVKAAGEIWVGDKKGKVHVLALESLEETAEFAAHGTNGVDVLVTSPDGTKVASGDHNR